MDRLGTLEALRLGAILAPFAAPGSTIAISLEDPDGGLIGGAPGSGGTPAASRDIRAEGRVVGRLVARGPGAGSPEIRAAMDALGLAIEALASERDAREVAEAGLASARLAADGRARRLDDELVLGRRLQRSFVAIVPPDVPGYDLASHYEAATEVGGDFFDLFRVRRRGRPLSIVVADVTGKGVAAALLMAFARPLLHAAVDHSSGPADALERANRVLVEERRSALFITAVCATLLPASGRVRVANAGHEPPLLVRADGSPAQTVEVGGSLLGAFASLGLHEAEVELGPGDMIVFYTDGVTDAQSTSGERFEDARLHRAIEAARDGSAHDVVESIKDEVDRFQVGGQAVDDITIVAIGRHRSGSARRARQSPGPAGRAHISDAV
jgi:serine phosphatase RsbU (regulator of sigma subunit)